MDEFVRSYREQLCIGVIQPSSDRRDIDSAFRSSSFGFAL